MSNVRPVMFPTLESELPVPHWLRTPASRVVPAPFSRAVAQESGSMESHGSPARGSAASEEPGEEPRPAALSSSPPYRRSTMPGRSLPPPAVIISRPPPSGDAHEEIGAVSEEQRAFARATLELASLRARTLLGIESELLALAVGIASAILEREIEADPELHGTLARAAIAALGDVSSARLRASREAYRAISEAYGEAALDVDGVRVQVVLDHSLQGLGVVAEAGASRVDGRIGERLGAVRRALEAEHRRAAAEEDR